MRKFMAAATLLALVNLPAGAQQQNPDPVCASRPLTGDVCQQAFDIADLILPQLGVLIAGGNATLGTGSTLGGFPRWSLGIRANVMNAVIPDADDISTITGAPRRSTIGTVKQFVGFPALDGAIGLWRGYPMGVTNVGGLDLLVSAIYVPNINASGSSIRTDGSAVRVGFGGRLGILQESPVIPGLSVTYLRRDFPRVDVVLEGEDDMRAEDVRLRTGAWRVVGSKRFGLFRFALGGGQDRYESSALLSAVADPDIASSIRDEFAYRMKMTRWNYFGDMTLTLPVISATLELGQATGGNLETFNTFQGTTADASRLYGSVGFRIAF